MLEQIGQIGQTLLHYSGLRVGKKPSTYIIFVNISFSERKQKAFQSLFIYFFYKAYKYGLGKGTGTGFVVVNHTTLFIDKDKCNFLV